MGSSRNLIALGFVFFALVAALVVSQNRPAAELSWERKAADMYQQVLSPFCPGRSLNDCPSSKAQELKTDMLVKLQSGAPQDVVLEEVFAKFGEQYRAVPRNEGFGRMVWLAPLLFIVLGAGVAWSISRRAPRKPLEAPSVDQGPASTPGLSGSQMEELERELSSLE